MLYETAARAAEILSLNVEDLDLEHRKAPLRSTGGDTEWVHWDTGTARHLPRLLRLPDGHPDGPARTRGPLFLSERRPVPARHPGAELICPHTGRARLGYDRARVLLDHYAGLDLHQLRHSAATHLGEARVPLHLIMAKTRHRNPRTAMRYTRRAAKPSPRSPASSVRPNVATNGAGTPPLPKARVTRIRRAGRSQRTRSASSALPCPAYRPPR
jgi:integrase